MTGTVVTLRQDWTAGDALAELRRAGPESESTYYLFVVDEVDRLLGVITANDLIEVSEDEATEDMYRMVGITGEEERVFDSMSTRKTRCAHWGGNCAYRWSTVC